MRLAILFAVLLAALPAAARDWAVPADAPTIAAGLDSAQVGDVVVVACGTYSEHSLVLKSGVTLRSETGLSDCVTIDAGWNGPVLIADYVDASCVVEGLRLYQGLSDRGGGMTCRSGSPHVLHCTFEACQCWSSGGAVLCTDGSTPVFESCVFSNNLVEAGNGGALAAYGSSPVLFDCSFSGNSAAGDGGAVDLSEGTVDISNCGFIYNHADNYGGALHIMACDGDVDGCEISSNTAGTGGGGALVAWGPVRILDTAISLNEAAARWGGGLMTLGYDVIQLRDCVVQDNAAPSGGGIQGGSDLLLVDTEIVTNQGGGLTLHGGLHLEGLRSTIRNNTGDHPSDCFIPENSSASLHCCDVDLAHWFDASVVWIDLVNCTVGNADATWGEVKALYR